MLERAMERRRVVALGAGALLSVMGVHVVSARDRDHDGLSKAEELKIGTNPRDSDSDDDGIKDGQEDSDQDG